MIEGLVADNALVLTKGRQEIDQRLGGDAKLSDRFSKGSKDGVRYLAAIAGVELFFPPAQQCHCPLRIPGLVGQIVRPAAVGVDVVEMLP